MNARTLIHPYLKQVSRMSRSADSMSPEALWRARYMQQEYRQICSSQEELQGLVFGPHATTPSGEDVWKGIVFVRLRESPWFGGAFAFTVTFPVTYPMTGCPTAAFDLPIPSHPFLLDGRQVEFLNEFTSLSFTSVSIMMRLLKTIRRLFNPDVLSEHGALEVVRLEEAQRDVRDASVVFPANKKENYFGVFADDMKSWLVQRSQTRASRRAPVDEWAAMVYGTCLAPSLKGTHSSPTTK